MRYGLVRFRLVILEPGSTSRDYALFRFGETSAWFGVASWACGTAVLGPMLGRHGDDWLPVVLATGLALLVAGLVHRSSVRVRGRARTAFVCAGQVPVSHATAKRQLAASEAAVLMVDADRLLAQGHIGVVDHELTWTRAWNLLPAPKGARTTPTGIGR